jgi:ATP-dependent Lon protease
MKFVKYIGIFVLFLVAAVLGLIAFAPKEISYNIKTEINAPVSKAWEVSMDGDRMKEWLQGFKSAKLIKGEEGQIGSVYELTFTEEGKDMVMEETVTAYEIEKQYAFIGNVKDFMTMENEMNFEAVDSNSCKIITHTKIKANSALMRLFMYNKEGSKKRAESQYLKLKEMIEE